MEMGRFDALRFRIDPVTKHDPFQNSFNADIGKIVTDFIKGN